MHILDASALLAVLRGEPGCEIVTPVLPWAVISAVNLSEVAVKLVERGMHGGVAETLLVGLQLDVRPFGFDDAIQAASLRAVTRSRGLSFGDRACLALGASLDATVLTADRAWAGLDRVELIR